MLFRTDAPADQATSTELLLFAMFTLRQLHNLGKNPAAKSLAMLLSTRISNLTSASEVDSYCKVVIASGRTDNGEKLFAGDLQSGDGRALFQMHTKGFGFLGRGVNYYAPQSVLVLLKFLSKRRANNDGYLRQLFFIASKCGELKLSKRISSLNQPQLALGLTLESSPKWEHRASSKAGLDTRTHKALEPLVTEFWELFNEAMEIPVFESDNRLVVEALLVQAETKLNAAEGCTNAIEKVWPDGDGVYDRFNLAINQMRQRHPGVRRFFDSLQRDISSEELGAVHREVMAKNRELFMLAGTYMSEAAEILFDQTGIEIKME